MKRCFEIRCCPASCYMICSAYKGGGNCWDTKGVPCCKRNDKERCKDCDVYKKACQ